MGSHLFHLDLPAALEPLRRSVRSSPGNHRLAAFDGILIRAKGDGHRFKFIVRATADPSSPLYQVTFATQRNVWEEHRLWFRQFVATYRRRPLSEAPPLDSRQIVSLGFLIADKQEGPFSLEIAWIKAVKLTATPSGGCP